MLPRRGGAKRDRIISTRTRKRTGRVVVGVAIRPRTRSLEHLRVDRRPASGR